jgi:hypothetical protein
MAMPAGLHAARVDSWFEGGDPWPCQSPKQFALLRRLEDKFAPLEANAKVGIGERVYSAACLIMATNSPKTHITEPAEDLSFRRFVAALRGHVVTFLGSQKK